MNFIWNGKAISLSGVSDQDWIYSSIVTSGNFYEIDLLEYIHFVLKGREGCILDIGANIGNHSVFLGMFVSDTVICFEPNPIVLPILKSNLSYNKIKHKLYELGLGEKKGSANIFLPSTSLSNIGASKLVKCDETSEELIPVVTLDSLIPEIKAFTSNTKIMAIKMDVEGMELAVLRGAIRALSENKPDLFIEIQNQEQMEAIIGLLKPLGYRKIVAWAATPVWHFVHRENYNLFSFVNWFFYIFFKKSKPYARLVLTKIKLALTK